MSSAQKSGSSSWVDLIVRSLLLTLLALSPAVIAEEATPIVSPSSLFTGDYLLQVIGSFMVVILLLVAVLIMLKRFNGVGGNMTGDMRVVSSVGVGQRERAVLLQVGEQQILVGVGPGNVRPLHVFDAPVVDTQNQSSPSFSDVWKVATGKAESSQ